MADCLSSRRSFLHLSSGILGSGFGISQLQTDGDSRITWVSDTPSTSRASPTVVDGIVYTGTSNGGLFALDAQTGEIIWHSRSISACGQWAAPAVANDLCYLKTGGTVYAVDKETGAIEWESEATGSGETSPTVRKDTCYLGGADGVYALDAFTGELLWQNDEMEGPVRSKVTVEGDWCFCNAIRTVVCLDRHGGELLWQTHDGGDGGIEAAVTARIPSSPIVNGDALLVGEGGEGRAKIHSLNVETGETQFSRELASRADGQVATPTVRDDFVVATVLTFSGAGTCPLPDNYRLGRPYVCLHGFDISDGFWNQQWTAFYDQRLASAPTIVGNSIYVGGYGGCLTVRDLPTGDIRWERNAPGPAAAGSIPIGYDGTLYIGTSRGVIAFDIDESGSSTGERVKQGVEGHHDHWHERSTIPLDRLEISVANGSLEPDSDSPITVEAIYGNRTRNVTELATLSSSDDTVLELESNTSVVARQPGSAELSATYGDIVANESVTVSDPEQDSQNEESDSMPLGVATTAAGVGTGAYLLKTVAESGGIDSEKKP
ncbi:MAG: PQQ-binding-like beta-propeller repeat protein [Natrialbaceae archaeon]|nr:PQQ-binding-like beta-propeller repeat protein [Natrialbaceae archaeon]